MCLESRGAVELVLGDAGGKTLGLYPVKLGCLWLHVWTTWLASGPHVSPAQMQHHLLGSGHSGPELGGGQPPWLEATKPLTHLKTNPGMGRTLRSLFVRWSLQP